MCIRDSFWREGVFDERGLADAAVLAATALAAGTDGPVRIGLGGLGDWLVAHGFDYDSEEARQAATRNRFVAACRASSLS